MITEITFQTNYFITGDNANKGPRKSSLRSGMNIQSQQRSQTNISDSRQSKSQLVVGSNKMNAENSKNWRDDAKGNYVFDSKDLIS